MWRVVEDHEDSDGESSSEDSGGSVTTSPIVFSHTNNRAAHQTTEYERCHTKVFLLSRSVEEVRAACVGLVGTNQFEQVYRFFKDKADDGASEDGEVYVHSASSTGTMTVMSASERFLASVLTPAQRSSDIVTKVYQLLYLEDQLRNARTVMEYLN